MLKKKGFTLVELAVVVGIIALLASIVIPLFEGNNGPPISGQVVEKERKFDINGYTVYRVTVQTQNGEKLELDSRSYHDQIQLHQWYNFHTNSNSHINSFESIPPPPQPGRIENGEIKY